jgi:hypothetical protein
MFSPNNVGEKNVFLFIILLVLTLIFKKMPIAESCDHYIDAWLGRMRPESSVSLIAYF